MAKGVIVVDKIPQNCRNIRGDTERGCPHGGMVCQIKGRDVMHHLETGTKPDWCPIQSIERFYNKINQKAFSCEIREYESVWVVAVDDLESILEKLS